MPLISVIIPVYNVEDYLHKCVNSVLSQNFKEIRITYLLYF
jgi:glycosyltransferase involved in cell wall biosynthesis